MASYYYLTASLPMLKPDNEPPFTEEQFLALCRRHLNPKDLTVLEKLSQNGEDETVAVHNNAAEAWIAFDRMMSAELAQNRAERLQVPDKETYAKSGFCPAAVREAVKKAVTADSPLEAEYLLFKVRFSYLEELSINHHFDLTRIVVYYLKLKMMIRKSYFNYELGEQEFKRLLSNIKTSINSV
ncbi:MAG: DUF2764 family protein [Spirochaetales bacterium]|nr:DUF2764 family protein [Spirochaetales bacterium]